MAQTVGEFFVQRLQEWGVHTIFGYPGDGINGVLGALQPRRRTRSSSSRRGTRRWPPSWRRAYAKFTGELGVCIATSGPGASHLITGLYDARLDHMPVLAIAGQQARDALGGALPAGTRSATACSRTSPAPSCSRRRRRRRCGIWSTARCASPSRATARDGARLAQRPAGHAVRGAAARARHACIPASATRAPKVVPHDDAICAAPPTC